MSSEDEETQRRFAARGARGGSGSPPAAAPVGGQRVMTRPGAPRPVVAPPTTAVVAGPVSHVAEVAAAAQAADAGPPPRRLSWYMPREEWGVMTRLRDELYHAAGAAGITLEKQDACAALARAIEADFATIKARALLDLQQRAQGR